MLPVQCVYIISSRRNEGYPNKYFNQIDEDNVVLTRFPYEVCIASVKNCQYHGRNDWKSIKLAVKNAAAMDRMKIKTVIDWASQKIMQNASGWLSSETNLSDVKWWWWWIKQTSIKCGNLSNLQQLKMKFSLFMGKQSTKNVRIVFII
jgi:hypothetical protein